MLANTFSDTKALWKTQYGLVHKFARYKQFHKHMIILKTSTTVTLHIKQISISYFFSFFKIMNWLCGNESSGFQQLQWRHSRWLETHSLNFLLASVWGWEWGHLKWKKKKKETIPKTIPWNKTRNLRNQNGLVRRAQKQDQKSRGDPLTSDP